MVPVVAGLRARFHPPRCPGGHGRILRPVPAVGEGGLRVTPPSASDRAQITAVVHVAVAAVERSDDPKETPYQAICGSAASPAKIWLLRH